MIGNTFFMHFLKWITYAKCRYYKGLNIHRWNKYCRVQSYDIQSCSVKLFVLNFWCRFSACQSFCVRFLACRVFRVNLSACRVFCDDLSACRIFSIDFSPSGMEIFFSQIQLIREVFSGEIYRELPCRWNHYIIISGSQSKAEKTMKNSVFSNLTVIP